MKILLIDYNNDAFSLQERYLKAGNTLYVHYQLYPTKKFPLSNVDGSNHCERLGLPKNRIIICNGEEGLERGFKECDFVFYDCTSGGKPKVMRVLRKLIKKYNKPVINNQLKKHTILENNRVYAKSLGLGYDMYETHLVKSFNEYKKIKTDKKFVIKAFNESSVHINSNFRTIIPQSKVEEEAILKEDRYNHFKSGGAVLEEFVDGIELCMGFYWDGSKVVGDYIFVNQEYKGVWDNDLGGVLCGECGSVFYPVKKNKLPKKAKSIISNLIAYMNKSFYDYKGFIDMNFMMKDDKAYLMEFTVRPGFPTEPILTYLINDYTEFMRCVATGDTYKGKVKKGITIAISVFGYGIPFIKSYDAKNPVHITGYVDNNNVALTSASYINNEFVTCCKDRPLIALGTANSIQKAKAKAYDVVSNIKIQGFVYRSDIGDKFEKALEMFNRLK